MLHEWFIASCLTLVLSTVSDFSSSFFRPVNTKWEVTGWMDELMRTEESHKSALLSKLWSGPIPIHANQHCCSVDSNEPNASALRLHSNIAKTTIDPQTTDYRLQTTVNNSLTLSNTDLLGCPAAILCHDDNLIFDICKILTFWLWFWSSEFFESFFHSFFHSFDRESRCLCMSNIRQPMCPSKAFFAQHFFFEFRNRRFW